MKIECITKFKDTVDGLPSSFEKGDVRSVSERDGARFIGHGWAVEKGSKVPSDAAAASPPVDLDIHNATLGSSDNLGA